MHRKRIEAQELDDEKINVDFDYVYVIKQNKYNHTMEIKMLILYEYSAINWNDNRTNRWVSAASNTWPDQHRRMQINHAAVAADL